MNITCNRFNITRNTNCRNTNDSPSQLFEYRCPPNASTLLSVGTKIFITRGVFKAPYCLNNELSSLIKLLYQPFFLSEGFIFRSLILFTVMNGDKASLIRQLNRLHFTLPSKPVSEFIVFSLYFEKTCPGCECLLRFYLCFCDS